MAIPERVTVIPERWFSRFKFWNLSLPGGVKAIEDRAFEGAEIHSIVLPEGLEHIGFRAFFGVKELCEIRIPDSVRFIDAQALVLNDLRKIEAGSGNEHYCSRRGVLFDKGRKTRIKYPQLMEEGVYCVPDTVETIADYAFCRAKIGKMILPKGLKTIGLGAF